MSTSEIVARLDARSSGPNKWVARCPAHIDRQPSLSIREGRDGRTLLQCFAGCFVDEIAAALGLNLSDLFERRSAQRSGGHRRSNHTPDKIIRALNNEAEHTISGLHERGISGELLTPELNTIRKRVATTMGINLAQLVALPYEGGYGGRDRDPLWPILLEHAWLETCIERLGFPLPTLASHAEHNGRPMPSLFIDTEERAACAMREIEKEGSRRV